MNIKTAKIIKLIAELADASLDNEIAIINKYTAAIVAKNDAWSIMYQINNDVSTAEINNGATPVEVENRFAAMVRDGNKLAAIKIYRETYGVGLGEAKAAVERLFVRSVARSWFNSNRNDALDIDVMINRFHNSIDYDAAIFSRGYNHIANDETLRAVLEEVRKDKG